MKRVLKLEGLLECAPENILALRFSMKHLFLDVEVNPTLIKLRHFQKELDHELTCLLFDILIAGKERNETLTFQRRIQLIQDMESWLLEADSENFTVYGLCETFQVNQRTLQRIFMERYGVSPKQYMLARRLNKVRKQLSQTDLARGKIADIANQWGFWHMGRFAMIYQR